MTINKQLPSDGSDEILDLLSKQAVDEQFIRREEKLFQQHVTTFASLLNDDVAQALKTEPTEELSKEFVDAAQALLKTIEYEGSIQGQKSDNSLDEEAEETIVQAVRKEIADELNRGFVPPDQQEINSHAQELAQCVLSNWFALLQKTKKLRINRAQPQFLNCDALPFNAFATVPLFDGIEAFALDLKTVERRFEQFLTTLTERSWLQQARAFLTRSSRCLVELAPDLVLLAQTQGGWILTESVNDAKEFLKEQSSRERNYLTRDLSQFDPDWVISGVCELEWPSRKARWDHQFLRGVIEMAANNAIQQNREPSRLAHFGFDNTHRKKEYQNLLIQLTQLTSKTIEQSLDFGRNPPSAKIFGEIRERVSDIRKTLEEGSAFPNESTMEICQAVIATATFAVAKCVRGDVDKKETMEELQDRVLSTQPDARMVLEIATQTATDVLKSREIQASLMHLRSSYKEI